MNVYICKMKTPELEKLLQWQEANKIQALEERRVVLPQILPVLNSMSDLITKEQIGVSHLGRPIFKISIGNGQSKVLVWTQMHGNESTGTRAFLDLLKFLSEPGPFEALSSYIRDRCTIVCIPILNPDGAEAYTRANAQGIDLNRDVIDLSAPESALLQSVLREVDPDYCFNLHDQRNIFSVGSEAKTATLSFLAPSEDPERSLTAGRKKTMRVIAAMNDLVRNGLEGHIGRYTDEFYPTATGDNFQKMGYSTVLIESGHYPGDLNREISRRFTFAALVGGLRYIVSGKDEANYRDYFKIPDNEKNYLDIIIRNVVVNGDCKSLGVLLKDSWNGKEFAFVPCLEKAGDLDAYGADKVKDGTGLVFDDEKNAEIWVQNEFN